MKRYVDFWQVTQDALDYALDSNGIDDHSLRRDLLNAYHELACYPEVPETLRNLKELGLGTAILSNGAPKMLEAGVSNSHLENVLDSIFSVDTIGVFKPAPQVYQMAVDQLGSTPEEILFFSSNAWDVSGAATFGFQAVWVNRFGQAPERLPGIPVLEITNAGCSLTIFAFRLKSDNFVADFYNHRVQALASNYTPLPSNRNARKAELLEETLIIGYGGQMLQLGRMTLFM